MAKTLDSEEEFIDHYLVLCLPSGEEGSKLSLKQIDKAYRDQSRKRHPDKRPNDPDATADFQRLTRSYEVLRDVTSRATFDARLRSIQEKAFRASLFDAKRRKLASDLEERERAAAAPEPDPTELAARKEKMVAAELQKELAAFQTRKAKKATSAPAPSPSQQKAKENDGVSLDEEKVLKVSWERDGRDYSAVQLTELFERFGRVEDVLIRSKGSKKKGSAIVVMSSKDAAVAATQSMIGDISNPLLVLPLRAPSSTSSAFPAKQAEPSSPKLDNIVGAGFQDYESSILKKLEMAKEKKRAP
ncbi:Dnaj-like subfamily c member 17 protein [Dioscorea alata]|uniref:Dnaj-like subfamily c member 17 protein n=3 Tax=Dioscorea alata TaxID=55571 RepID=A0ACB7WPH1_DIOAL|nr:Dnaj-like subfamily c member 17 protein [Dioscorea alata]KAH7690085.1 Dnaj-like subfamily c member 17 protein [Dioscorea alata]KAH7690086.1 Dnaj-like subfamily c member 17 protein [Dioscorea alata]